tara:strand:+ start:23337 stop:24161 length:825 start_codon:yes stop_codon:yes gene_type:complete
MYELCISVPITNRRFFFDKWLPAMKDYLKQEEVKDYCIVATEQEKIGNYYFSLSMSRNVGLYQGFNRFGCKYVASVDVDIIPIKGVDYTWQGRNETNFTSFGGTKIDRASFEETNGYCPLFHGWGYEDTDFIHRLEHKGCGFIKWAENVGGHAVCLDLERGNMEMEHAKIESRTYWGFPRDYEKGLPLMIGAAEKPGNRPDTHTGWRMPTCRDTNMFIINMFHRMSSYDKNRYIKIYGVSALDMSKIWVEELEKDVFLAKYIVPHVYNMDALSF